GGGRGRGGGTIAARGRGPRAEPGGGRHRRRGAGARRRGPRVPAPLGSALRRRSRPAAARAVNGLYVYALVEGGGPLRVRGLAREPLRLVPLGGIAAVVGAMPAAPAPSARNASAHD